MKNKIIYAIVGIILIVFNFSNRVRTVDDKSLECLENARTFDTNTLWEGYELGKYPVDFWYNSSKEFRVADGKISEKEPDQMVVSIEALKDNGNPIIKAIPYDKYKSITGGSGPTPLRIQRTYESLFIHEGFHCYQMEHGLSKVEDIAISDNSEDIEFENFRKVSDELNRDENFKKLWEREYQGLIDFYESGDASSYIKAKAGAKAYIKEKFPGQAADFFNTYAYREYIEGSARFIEELYRIKTLGDSYINPSERIFASINNSLYDMGSLKAKILEKYYPEWRNDLSFDSENNFDILLERGNIL